MSLCCSSKEYGNIIWTDGPLILSSELDLKTQPCNSVLQYDVFVAKNVVSKGEMSSFPSFWFGHPLGCQNFKAEY